MTRIASIPVRQLRGVGPRLEEKLADCGVRQVEDLLFHLPRSEDTEIGAARNFLAPGIEWDRAGVDRNQVAVSLDTQCAGRQVSQRRAGADDRCFCASPRNSGGQ